MPTEENELPSDIANIGVRASDVANELPSDIANIGVRVSGTEQKQQGNTAATTTSSVKPKQPTQTTTPKTTAPSNANNAVNFVQDLTYQDKYVPNTLSGMKPMQPLTDEQQYMRRIGDYAASFKNNVIGQKNNPYNIQSINNTLNGLYSINNIAYLQLNKTDKELYDATKNKNAEEIKKLQDERNKPINEKIIELGKEKDKLKDEIQNGELKPKEIDYVPSFLEKAASKLSIYANVGVSTFNDRRQLTPEEKAKKQERVNALNKEIIALDKTKTNYLSKTYTAPAQTKEQKTVTQNNITDLVSQGIIPKGTSDYDAARIYYAVLLEKASTLADKAGIKKNTELGSRLAFTKEGIKNFFGAGSAEYKEALMVTGELQALSPIIALNVTPMNKETSILGAIGLGIKKGVITVPMANVMGEQDKLQAIQKLQEDTKAEGTNIATDVATQIKEEGNFSEKARNTLTGSVEIAAAMALDPTMYLGGELLQLTKIGKVASLMSKGDDAAIALLKNASNVGSYEYKLLNTATKIAASKTGSKAVEIFIDTAKTYAQAELLVARRDDFNGEVSGASMATANLAAELGGLIPIPMLKSGLGVFLMRQLGRSTKEITEEFTEDAVLRADAMSEKDGFKALYDVFSNTDKWNAYKNSIIEDYGDISKGTEFVLLTTVMALGMGSTTEVGKLVGNMVDYYKTNVLKKEDIDKANAIQEDINRKADNVMVAADEIVTSNTTDGDALSESIQQAIDEQDLDDSQKAFFDYLMGVKQETDAEAEKAAEDGDGVDNTEGTQMYEYNPQESEAEALNRISLGIDLNDENAQEEIKNRVAQHTLSYFNFINSNGIKETNGSLPRVQNFFDNTVKAVSNYLSNKEKWDAKTSQTFENGSRIDENGNQLTENEYIELKETVKQLRKDGKLEEIDKINKAPKAYYDTLLFKNDKAIDKSRIQKWKDKFEELKLNNDTKGIQEHYDKLNVALNGIVKGDENIAELQKLKKEIENYANENDWSSSVEATAKALEGVELKNEGKAEAPTKENVTERLNINNPFYKKVEDALVKLGLIEKYNPETGTGDVVGGYAQATSDGGISAGKMMFNKDGSISYFDGDVKVSFDKNGNVISENTKEVAAKNRENEIEGKKEAIANLEKTRDSENFKYKEVTETDPLGNRKKVKRLKTAQELKESTDKINAAIDKAKSELAVLEGKKAEPTYEQKVEATAKALEGVDINQLAEKSIPSIGVLDDVINEKVYKDPNKASRWRIKGNNFTYSSKKEASQAVESEYKRNEFARSQQIKKQTPQSISEAYHKAKADGSNPELVKAVEELLGKTTNNNTTDNTQNNNINQNNTKEDEASKSETSTNDKGASSAIQQDSTSGKEQQGGSGTKNDKGNPKQKVKTLRRGKRKENRVIKSPDFLKALSHTVFEPYEVALQYFISGGKIHSTAILEMFRNSHKEFSARIGLVNNTSGRETIDAIGHFLWENQLSDDQYTSEDFSNAVAAVLLDNETTSDMVLSINSRYKTDEEILEEYEKQRYQEYLDALESEQQYTPEDIDEAIGYYESLSQDDIDKMINASDELLKQDIDRYTISSDTEVDTDNRRRAKKEFDDTAEELKKKLDKASQQLKNKKEEIVSQSQLELFGDTPKSNELFGVEKDVSKDNVDKILQPLIDAENKAKQELESHKANEAEYVKKYDNQLSIDDDISLQPKQTQSTDLQQAASKVKDALDDLNKMGFAFDPKSEAKKQVALTDAIVNYVKELLKAGYNNFADAIKQIKKDLGAKWDLASKKTKDFTEQQFNKANINFSSSVGKNPNASTKEQKQLAKKVLDLFKKLYGDAVGVQVLSSEKAKEILEKLGYKNVQQMASEIKNKLVVVHNIRPQGILNALRLGGLPMPSLAIIDPNNDFSGYGNITLIANPNLIDPKKNKKSNVFKSDVYSARYPSITYIVKGKINLAKSDRDNYSIVNAIQNSGYNGFTNSKEVKIAYLNTKGIDTSKIDSSYEAEQSIIDKSDFEKFAKKEYAKINVQEKIFKGYTYQGNRRYVEHTLSNVLKEMKSLGIRNGEIFGYGAGSVRASITTKFKSLQEIKNNQDVITGKKEFESAKDAINTELIELLDKLKPYTEYATDRFGYYDDAGLELADLSKRGQSEMFKNVPKEILQEVNTFLVKLNNAPTEYFEAKINDAVELSQFDTAVVPKDTQKEVIEALQKSGLNVVFYESQEQRQKLVNEISAKRDLQFFQTPQGEVYGFQYTDENGKPQIVLDETKLNPNTAIHEYAHPYISYLEQQANGNPNTKTIYHGTTTSNAKSINKNGFDYKKTADGSIWFTDRKDKIESGEVGASYNGAIVEMQIDESKLKLGGWDEQDKYSVDELIAKGYDGLKLEEDGEVTYQIFNTEKLLPKNEAKAIYEAMRKVVLDEYNEKGADSYLGRVMMNPAYNQQVESLNFNIKGNFEKWVGENKLVSESELQNAKSGQPIVVRGYHGTTNEFYKFDSSVKGNIEGHLGKVNYFTTDFQDASMNYQADGKDLTSRVEQFAERLENDLMDLSKEDVLSEYNITEEEYETYINESEADLARLIAEREINGGTEKVLDLYVKLNNPVVLGNGSTWFETLNISDEDLEQAAQEIADENDITIEEAKEDYEWDIRDRAIEITGYENLAIEALSDALNANGYDGSIASEILGDNLYDTEIDLNKLEKDLRKAELYENDNGEMASSQVIADFFQNLGYDGIVLTDVSERFKNMGLNGNTSHIHVFDKFSNQIKLADGSNTTFNPNTNDIRFSADGETQPFNPNQKPTEKQIQEALATLTGDRGARLVEQAQKGKWTKAIEDFFKWLGEKLGIVGKTPKQIMEMTIEQLGDAIATDLLSGEAKFSGSGNSIDLQIDKGIQQTKDTEDITVSRVLAAKANGLSLKQAIIVIEKYNDVSDNKIDIDDFIDTWNGNRNNTGNTSSDSGGANMGNKALANRAYTGGTDDSTKEAILQLGLDYEIENQEIAENTANDFISKVGIEQALIAAKSGEVKSGAVMAVVYAKAIDDIEMRKKDATIEDMQNLISVQKDLIDVFDTEAREHGRFISMLARIYKNSKFQYNAQTNIKQYEAITGRPIPDDIRKKFIDLEAKIKELEQREAELTEQLEAQRTQQAIDSIQESIKRDKGGKSYAFIAKAKSLADRIRSKKNKAVTLLDADGNEVEVKSNALVDYNAILELVASIVEKTGDVAASIDKAISIIENKDWYKKLTDKGKKAIKDRLINDTKDIDAEGVSADKFSIPHKFLRDLIMSGVTNADDLVQAVLDEYKPLYPDLDAKMVRRIISKYGETKEDTRDDIDKKIGELKRVLRLMSAKEDLLDGKAPKRSGYRRDDASVTERILRKEIEQLLKALPKDQEQIDNEWKTAVSRYEARLNNQINELQDAIDRNVAINKNRNAADYNTDDIKDLKQKLQDKKQEYESHFGSSRKVMTDEQRLQAMINAKQRAVDALQEMIANNELERRNKPFPSNVSASKLDEYNALKDKHKELSEDLNRLRKENGIAEKKRLEAAKNAAIRRIKELKEKIDNKDFSVQKPKKLEADAELDALRIEKQKLADEYEIEKFRAEQQNRPLAVKMFSLLVEMFGLPKLFKATLDLSAPFRQGMPVFLSNPKLWFLSFLKMHKQAKSNSYFESTQEQIRGHELYILSKDSGLSLTGLDSKVESKYEDSFDNRIYQALEARYPKITKMSPVAASNRGHSGFLNNVRYGMFVQGVKELQNSGIFFDENKDAYKALAMSINNITGRGVSASGTTGRIFNALLFSPRIITSRIGMFYDLINPYGTSVSRKLALYNVVSTAAWIYMFNVVGAAVADAIDDDDEQNKNNFNPISTDFTKVVSKNTTFDPSGGFAPLVKAVARVAYGKRINHEGKETDMTKGYSEKPTDEIVAFFENKMSPSASFIYNITNRRNPANKFESIKDADVYDYAGALFVPLTVETIYENTTDEDSKERDAVELIMSFYGFGVQSYDKK